MTKPISSKNLPDEAVSRFKEALGAGNFSTDPVFCDSYAMQPFHKTDPGCWIPRPMAVALPGSTEDVQAVVKICIQYGLRYKAHSTGWGAHGGPGYDNVVQIDLRRMNNIVEWDEKNRYVVVEPYVNCAELQAEAMKRGYNIHIHGAGSVCSPLANATSHCGMGWTGISTSTSSRNILGVEWVLPSGEVLKLGTCGSSGRWFSADGPGPGLRGIMRGWAGADGGLGVFTKMSMKLFHWAGPKETRVGGRLLDLEVEKPDNFRIAVCAFPEAKAYADALLKIGEAEIGFLQCKNPVSLLFSGGMPRLLRKIHAMPNTKKLLDAFRYQFQFMIAATSELDYQYQNQCLNKIVDDHGGILLDTPAALNSITYWSFVRVSVPPVIFRMGGNFFSAFGGDEALDNCMEQARIGEEIKRQFIARNACFDDLADGAWSLIYENGLFGHNEELYAFDHRDPEMGRQLDDFAKACTQATVEHNLGGGGFAFFKGGEVHDLLGPSMSNYHIWQRRIKKALDPDDLSDSKYYISSD
ncbi:MAG: FAD-binding oxidoreductase [Thermodesulfobacteriota bacterium]